MSTNTPAAGPTPDSCSQAPDRIRTEALYMVLRHNVNQCVTATDVLDTAVRFERYILTGKTQADV